MSILPTCEKCNRIKGPFGSIFDKKCQCHLDEAVKRVLAKEVRPGGLLHQPGRTG